jgi:nitrogen fixation/metabolism regulation signal transduction histidine kinase
MARKPRARRSLAGRVALVIVVTAVLVAVATLAFDRLFDSWLLAGAVALLATLPPAIWLTGRALDRWSRGIRAVTDGISSLKDRDFSVSVTASTGDEVGDLTREYNSLGDRLRQERLDLYQRELLLDTVVQTTPLALVLTNASDAIVFGNIAARQLFAAGRKIEGLKLGELLAKSPAPLREAVESGVDTLFTVEVGGEAEVFHVSHRPFTLNSQPHRLLLFKQLTREMAAQEVAIWKKVIRVIAHELNNSLAPITSLAHSGQALAGAPDAARLTRVFSTIEERASHLATFIEGYARFAKLPRPRPAPVAWRTLLSGLQDSLSFRVVEPLPAQAGWFDATQIEQVLINLIKNAIESGSPEDEVTVAAFERHGGVIIEVADRGGGLAGEVLRDALLPFYSTKPKGTGLGLTLCREIVDAHGGRLSIANREGGGAVVTVWLPQAAMEKVPDAFFGGGT